jgi:hypothetical protein
MGSLSCRRPVGAMGIQICRRPVGTTDIQIAANLWERTCPRRGRYSRCISCAWKSAFADESAPTGFVLVSLIGIVPTLCVGMHRLTLRVTGRTRSVLGGVTTRSVGTMRYRNPAANPWERWVSRLAANRWERTCPRRGRYRRRISCVWKSAFADRSAPTGLVRVTQLDRPHAPRGNASTDAPRYGQDAERPGLRYHAERGNDEV